MFFILTLLSSLSAAIFVNVNNSLASAKKSSHSSSGGDNKDTSNGDIISSKGSNGDGSSNSSSSGGTTTTPSTDQGKTSLSTTTSQQQQQQQPDNSNCNTVLMVNCGSFKPNNPTTTSTITPISQQPGSNCNTKLMLGCASGGSLQCIVAPCGPSSTTSTNSGNSSNGSVTGGGSVQCIVAPCGTSSTTTTNGSPLTPQQQYQQCASGIGGAIPGNCSPPPATITEQNRPLQTLNPQHTCFDGSTPAANGMCTSPTTETQLCPANQIRDDKGNCVSSEVAQAIKTGTLVDIGGGKFQLATVPPLPNTNTIVPICPKGSHLELNYCVPDGSRCPSGTFKDEDAITCSSLNPNLPHYPIYNSGYNSGNISRSDSSPKDQLPDGSCPEGYHYEYTPDTSIQKPCLINVIQKNPDGSCPPGFVLNTFEECKKIPVLPGSHTGSGGGFIQMFPESPPATSPPATSPSKTSQYLPPPVVK
jgi:hypothetical protein